ncbi:MAG: CGLD27 family protein [Gloeomargarita sp. SKYG116]|nr:CGLD27 family protein [Gloeomargarita sp. SKYG116]MDW8400169.1 CGLD27 family protein [Gloeomargarita sp. SKYGB_i_bin116]
MSLCPVPLEQQPLQEYQALRDSWFYQWPTLGWAAYGRRLLAAAGLGATVAVPVAAASFDPGQEPWLFSCAAVAGAAVLPSFLLLRLYLGWRYVQQRLASRTIVYEESGWYDGRTWEKPPAVFVQERLVSIYQVEPLLRRLRWSLVGMGLLYAAVGGLGWLCR